MARFFLGLCVLVCICSPAHADTLRIASYNVKYLSACVNYVRKDALESTFESLNADIIALQEVRNRQALEYFFDTSSWHVIIDDQSTDDQKLAFVVREGIDYRLASGNHLDAEKSDFLFSDSTFFPDDRDVLRLFVNVPELDGEIEILNHHAKSRYNGRVYSEARRIEATSEIVDYLRAQSESPYAIVLGDFNDNPDDASVNTLELGYRADRNYENNPGSFLVNLAEPLLIEDIVSYGLNSRNDKNGAVDPTVIGSRDDNYLNYSDEHEVTKALYDQILVTPNLATASHLSRMELIKDSVAVTGNSDTRASDHAPIYVDLFDIEGNSDRLKITGLLPNPTGSDHNREQIQITSDLGYRFDDSVTLRDEAGNRYELQLQIASGTSKSIVPTSTRFSLNNVGDRVDLLIGEEVIDTFNYQLSDEGRWITRNEQ